MPTTTSPIITTKIRSSSNPTTMKIRIRIFLLLLSFVSASQNRNLAYRNGFKNAVASALSAGCVKTLLQPIDSIKTVQQYENLGILDACKHLWSRPGNIRNFYAGLGVTVFGSMPSVALYFGLYSVRLPVTTQHIIIHSPPHHSTANKNSSKLPLVAATHSPPSHFPPRLAIPLRPPPGYPTKSSNRNSKWDSTSPPFTYFGKSTVNRVSSFLPTVFSFK